MTFAGYPGIGIAFLLLIVPAILLFFAYRSEAVRKAGFWRWILAFLQYAVIVALILLLWDPSRNNEKEGTLQNTVLVYFDTSQSMSVTDMGTETRLDRAIDIFQKGFGPGRADRPRYKIFGFDRSTYASNSLQSLLRWGGQSNLCSVFESLQAQTILSNEPTKNSSRSLNAATQKEQDLRNSAIAGAILFTDGQADTKSPDFYTSPDKDSFPLAIIGVGSPQPANDLAVHSIDGPARVLIDTTYAIDITIQAKGISNQTIHITLLQDDTPAGRQSYHVTKPDEQFTLAFPLAAGSLGIHTLTVKAESIPNESNTANNTRSTIVEVVSEPQLKVLYYSKVACFDVGKIRQALAHDKKVDLDFRLDAILAQKKNRPRNRYQWNEAPEERGDSRLSQDGSEFLNYDVIIFDLYTLQELSRAQIDSLYNFVSDRGGGLIIHANDPIDDKILFDKNLQALLPFDVFQLPSENPLQPEEPPSITPEGLRFGILREDDLTAPYALTSAYFDLISPKPAATTLLRTQMTPLVMIHQVGRGHVCLLNMRNAYRWYREDLDGGLLREFCSGLTAYIGRIPKKDAGLDLYAERDEADPSSIQINAFVYDSRFQPVSGATVLIEAGDDVIRLDESGDGKYMAAIQAFDQEALLLHAEAEQNGNFLGEKTRSFYLPLRQTEMEHVEKDLAFLEKLTSKTGAAYFELSDVDMDTWKMFPATREVLQANNTTSIWRRWPLFGSLCIALTVIWFIRRAVGLV